jgi:purine-nucleoside phosphorylase
MTNTVKAVPRIAEPSGRRAVTTVNACGPSLWSQAPAMDARLDISLKEGVYLWYSGPSVETLA